MPRTTPKLDATDRLLLDALQRDARMTNAALAAYSADQTRRVSLQAAVVASRDALTLARQRYESGITSFIDVLTADRTLEQNELALAETTTAVSTDLVLLYKTLGGGWESQQLKPPS